jgi:hypothetical protein
MFSIHSFFQTDRQTDTFIRSNINHVVLDQNLKLDFYSASTLTQQSTDKHVAPFGNIQNVTSI